MHTPHGWYGFFALAISLAATQSALAEQAKLETTGPLIPIPGEYEHVYGIDDQGNVVGDWKEFANSPPEAFRWTPAGDMVHLGWITGGNQVSRAIAISGDGGTIVGHSFHGGVPRAIVRPTFGTAMIPLEAIDATPIASSAEGVSHDGRVVVGVTQTWGARDRAFRFQAAPERRFDDLGSLAGADGTSRALGVSADGETVVGETEIVGGATHAFRWTASGMVDLGTIDGAAGESRAYGVSSDGVFIVGESATSDGFTRAFLYTEGGTMQALPTIGDYPGDSLALTVSNDGRTVAGTSASAEFPEGEACIWLDGVAVSMRETLSERFGYGVENFVHFKDARCSPDGLKFAGNTLYQVQKPTPPALPPPIDAAYRVTIAPDLEPPLVVSDVPSGSTITLRGNETFRATVTASDPDGGSIRLSSNGGPTGRIFTPPQGTKVEGGGALVTQLEWKAPLLMGGWNTSFSFGFTDAFGTQRKWECDVVVLPNASPEVDTIAPVVAECENGVHVVTLSAVPNDPEMSPMLVKWIVDGVEIDVKENVPSGLTQTFEHAYSHGVHDVEFRAWDYKTAPTIVRTTVAVEDTEAPVLIVAQDVTVSTDPGKNFASNVALTPPTAYDESGHEVTVSSDARAVYPLGTNEVVWTATDEDGHVATATQKVKVVDEEAPKLPALPDVRRFCDPAKLFATVELRKPTATDNVPGKVVVTTPLKKQFRIGKTRVVWTATDAAGNKTTKTQNVIVINRRPKANAGKNVTITTTSEKGARVVLDGRLSSDPDKHALKYAWRAPKVKLTPATAPKTSGLFKVGSTVVTLTVTDAGGLKHADTLTVTVKLKNAKRRPRGSDANRSFAYAAQHAGSAAASGVGNDAALSGLAYASAASAYGDAAGEFVRWEEGQSEADALIAYAQLRTVQATYGDAAAQALLAAYAETGDENLLAAYGYAAYGTAYAAADLSEE